MKINLELSQRSIKDAIRQVEEYEEKLHGRMGDFVQELAEVGIAMAYQRMNGSKYDGMVKFYYLKDTSDSENTVSGNLIGENTKTIPYGDAHVSPIAMSEFGSGWLAYVLYDFGLNVGQGTFPGQTHAEDVGGWWYIDPDTGERVHTFGESPTYPMYNAYLEMLQEVDSVAQRVFSGL